MTTQQNTIVKELFLQPQSSVYLSDTQIAARYGVSRVTVWRWKSNDPKFPSPIKLSAGCTRWKLSDLESWEVSK